MTPLQITESEDMFQVTKNRVGAEGDGDPIFVWNMTSFEDYLSAESNSESNAISARRDIINNT